MQAREDRKAVPRRIPSRFGVHASFDALDHALLLETLDADVSAHDGANLGIA
ncbi:hypothetical protein D3C87_2150210 [compost metagenome]